MMDFARQVAEIQQKLDAIKQLGNNPALLQQVLSGNVLAMPQPEQVQTGSSEPATQPVSLSKQQETLLAFYDEFAQTDDGKALAIGLSKFAKFVQTKVAK